VTKTSIFSVLITIIALFTVLLYLKERRIRQEYSLKVHDLQVQLSSLGTKECGIAETAPSAPAQLVPSLSAEAIPPQLSSAPLTAPVSQTSPSYDSRKAFTIRTRIGAIGRFVALSEDQHNSLHAKFEAEEALKEKNLSDEEYNQELEKLESLEEIVGAQTAIDYRNGVNETLERVRIEQTEKDVLLTSRQLDMTPEQEQKYRDIASQVEKEIEASNPVPVGQVVQRNMEDTLRLLKKQNEMRQKLFSDRLKGVLSDEQYNKFLEQQALSAEQQLGFWHGIDDDRQGAKGEGK